MSSFLGLCWLGLQTNLDLEILFIVIFTASFRVRTKLTNDDFETKQTYHLNCLLGLQTVGETKYFNIEAQC